MLTSTFSTWNAANGLIEYMRRRHPRMGIDGPTGNPVVGECNDGWLNDIRGRHVQAVHAVRALLAARPMTGRDGHHVDALTREQIERARREWHRRG